MSEDSESLDPVDWETYRAIAHRMVDDAVEYIRDVRSRPVWQDMPPDVRARFRNGVPEHGVPLHEVYRQVVTDVLPYPMGNIHPRFWMWYMGASNFTGAMGDFLAAILGSNLGGGDHAAAEIDKQVVDWMKEMVALFPVPCAFMARTRSIPATGSRSRRWVLATGRCDVCRPTPSVG